ncbi:MAG: hypothetical protein WC789_05350 [Lentisphaeria bacterium]|jgi:uncharacterized protein YxjI
MTQQPPALEFANRFQHTKYMVRRKLFTLLGRKFHVYDEAGNLAFYSYMKAFKLKEDIRLYTGEDMQTELLRIKARQIIDFSAAYDVEDAVTGEKVGALRRRGLKSILRDEWLILDPADREIGRIREDSMVLALVRRFLTNLVPQHYTATLGDTPAGDYRQHFNPFILKLDVDFTKDAQGKLDRRLALAAAILLCAIEGRQQ